MDINTLCLLTGIKPADLSVVDDPRGRVDFLASKLIEQGVKGLAFSDQGAAIQATYQAARPLIDGLLMKHLGHVRIPEEAMTAIPDVITTLKNVRESST